VLYDKIKRFQESITEMETVLSIDPENSEALNFIGYSYADRGIHLDEAESMIKRALKYKSDNGYMIDSLGWVYFRQNRFKPALQYLKRAAELVPDDPTIAEHLGDAYEKNGLTKEALEAFGRALKAKPYNGAVIQKIERLQKQLSK
jgi:tetratricopeptide (TPR) repeat protein